jgi:hypothetical protein
MVIDYNSEIESLALNEDKIVCVDLKKNKKLVHSLTIF